MFKEITTRFPMNLQYFAEGDPEPEPTPDPEPNPEPVKTFTQEDLDRIVADRIARERKRADERLRIEREEAERKKLEEASEYKTLYERAQADLETERQAAKEAQLSALKTTLLLKAGYTVEQIPRLSKYVVGDDEQSIVASVDELKLDMPPKSNDKPIGAPTNGSAQAVITKEQFSKMGYSERVRLMETNPDLYRQLRK